MSYSPFGSLRPFFRWIDVASNHRLRSWAPHSDVARSSRRIVGDGERDGRLARQTDAGAVDECGEAGGPEHFDAHDDQTEAEAEYGTRLCNL
jgi:hypothetical protein